MACITLSGFTTRKMMSTFRVRSCLPSWKEDLTSFKEENFVLTSDAAKKNLGRSYDWDKYVAKFRITEEGRDFSQLTRKPSMQNRPRPQGWHTQEWIITIQRVDVRFFTYYTEHNMLKNELTWRLTQITSIRLRMRIQSFAQQNILWKKTQEHQIRVLHASMFHADEFIDATFDVWHKASSKSVFSCQDPDLACIRVCCWYTDHLIDVRNAIAVFIFLVVDLIVSHHSLQLTKKLCHKSSPV